MGTVIARLSEVRRQGLHIRYMGVKNNRLLTVFQNDRRSYEKSWFDVITSFESPVLINEREQTAIQNVSLLLNVNFEICTLVRPDGTAYVVYKIQRSNIPVKDKKTVFSIGMVRAALRAGFEEKVESFDNRGDYTP